MKPILVCFGEVLWDLLPSGKLPGGAPMNVAYHAHNFGLQSRMISRVGDDALGEELLDFLRSKDISTELIQRDPSHRTGVVDVFLDEKGSAKYDIVKPVAWDFIGVQREAEDWARRADAFVFGSLACRNEATRNTVLRLLDLVTGHVVFDVNLRAPFYSRELLEELLPKAGIVKMNDEELDIITGWYTSESTEEAKMAFLKGRFGLKTLVVTRGKDGAACLTGAGLFTQSGFPVQVQDTIGSGDSFLAAFLKKRLEGADIQDCLAFACMTGALVATKKGGTPFVRAEEVEAFFA